MATPRNGPPPSAADLLEQQLARLPDAFQAMQDRAIAEAVKQAGALVDTHLSDRHRVSIFFPNIDGGGATITAGQKCNVQMPWSYEIIGWTLAAEQGKGARRVDEIRLDGETMHARRSSGRV